MLKANLFVYSWDKSTVLLLLLLHVWSPANPGNSFHVLTHGNRDETESIRLS